MFRAEGRWSANGAEALEDSVKALFDVEGCRCVDCDRGWCGGCNWRVGPGCVWDRWGWESAAREGRDWFADDYDFFVVVVNLVEFPLEVVGVRDKRWGQCLRHGGRERARR